MFGTSPQRCTCPELLGWRFVRGWSHLAILTLVSFPLPMNAQPTLDSDGNSSPFDLRRFGVTGTDVKTDTEATQRAVDACAAAGGGRVVVPAGPVITVGSVRLRSHVELYLERGAVLRRDEGDLRRRGDGLHLPPHRD